MKRPTLAAALVGAVIATTLPVLAQIAPSDTGAGVERGMQEMNKSGQVGTVTLFGHGANTTVVLNIKSAPAGRELSHIHRGKGCDSPSEIDPTPAYALHDVVGGRATTVVPVPEAKLLSGNYVVIVHANQKGVPYVSCGQLYAR